MDLGNFGVIILLKKLWRLEYMKLFEFIPEGAKDCKVSAWLHINNEVEELTSFLNPAIIICPGGGYGMVSDREA